MHNPILAEGMAIAMAASMACMAGQDDPFWAATAPRKECRVHLKLLSRNNMPLVEAEVDGAKGTFLLDTGATHTTFDLAFVKENLPQAKLTPVAMMAESNVAGAPRYMRVKSMKLGAAEFCDFGAMALDLSHLHASVGAKVDGILGMSTIGRVPCIVSFGAGEVVFVPGKESLAGFGRPVQRSLSDPMSVLLPVKFGDRTVEVLVDSGASFTFLSRETGWPTTGEAASVPAVDINGKAKLAPLVGKKGVLPVGDGIEVSPLVVSAPMNRIGSDVLKKYDMLIAGRYVSFRSAASNLAVKASSFGFDPEDSTEILQKALDSGARKIVVDKQASPWITRPLFVRSNSEIVFERGVEVVAKKGAFLGKCDSLLTLDRAENVKVSGYGATLRMHRADYAAPPYTKAEWRMSINLRSCRNVTIEGLSLVESGGDGVYVGVAGKKGGPCRDIVLRDLVCDRQYRQGISVISVRNLLIERCVLRNTGGTPPAAGIDFEPNHPSEELDGIVMRDCTISDNRGTGLAFYFGQLDSTSKPVSIKIENCRSSGNACGFGLSNGRRETFVRGRVACEGCTFENERGYAVRLRRKPADSVFVDFLNCCFVNCQTNAQDAAKVHDMFVGDAALGAGPTDGVSFRDCTIRQPVARDWLPRGRTALLSDGPSQITGNLTVVSPSGSTAFALDAAWRDTYFEKPVLADAPKRRAFDPALARPFDSRPGELVRLKPFRFRNGVTYRFFMSAPGEARFSGRFTKVGRPSFVPKPIVIKDAAGKTCATINLNGTDETPFSFTANAAGFYTMTADGGSHAFGLSATSVPIAVTPSGLDRSIYASQGSLFFRAAADTPFIVAVSGANAAERVRAQVADPAGRVVWDCDRIFEWTAYRSDAHPAEGLWRITFKRPSDCTFEDFSVLQQGAAPEFFLTPEKCW